jgi:hypothetical protein
MANGSATSRRSRYFQTLRIPAAVACLFAALMAGYYFLYVTRNSRYFVGRDLRLLGAIATELQALIDNDSKVVSGLLGDKYGDDGNKYFRIAGERHDRIVPRRKALEAIPVLRMVELVKRGPEGPLPLRFTEEKTDVFWLPRQSETTASAPVSDVTIPLQRLVTPLFVGEIQSDLFDSLALATTDGRVILQSGNPDLAISNLSKLWRRSDSKSQAELGSDAFAHSADVFDVRVSGSDYTLFIRGCCEAMRAFSSKGEQAPVLAGGHGWVLAGLVPASRFSAAAYAFPFPAIRVLSALLLLAVFAAPFIKFLLIGQLQRVTAHDVLLVGVCALMAASFVTLFAMDRYAVSSLTDTLDAQLQTLASNIRANAKQERDRAFAQVAQLEQIYTERRRANTLGDPEGLRREEASCDGGTRLENVVPPQSGEPSSHANRPGGSAADVRGSHGPSSTFDTFVLIDARGCQQVKWSYGSLVTPLISVKSREYFNHWQGNAPADQPFVEPIRSATTGTLEAVLSTPSTVRDNGIEVAALTIPMRSLLNPVLINGFGFVVVADDGRVLFHSDPEHNLSENFFAETDQSRRLRALVAAKHSELLNINYWGDGHRAFVTSMNSEGFPWSLVTFYDRQLLDTVNIEWFLTAVVFILFYCSAYVLIGLGTVLLRPTYRAPWVWPDFAHSATYLRLFWSYVFFAAAWLAALRLVDLPERLWIICVLPLLAWALAFVTLNRTRRPWMGVFFVGSTIVVGSLWLVLAWVIYDRDSLIWRSAFLGVIALASSPHLVTFSERGGTGFHRMAPPLNLSYGLAAGALLVLVAVLPAVTFFTIAHNVHIGTLVRHAQLSFARDLSERERAEPRAEGQTPVLAERRLTPCRGATQDLWTASCDPGIYSDFFFCTRRVGDSPDCDQASGPVTGHESKTHAITVPQILEEMLPFYSEAAVKSRELMHDGTDESGWTWNQRGRELTFASRESPQILFASAMPLLTGNGPFSADRFLVMLVGFMAIIATIVSIVRFGLRRIFVADLTMPLWSGRRGEVPVMSGPNLFLLSKNDAATFLQPSSYCEIDLRTVQAGAEAQRSWFDEEFEKVAQLASERNVLISHFDDRVYDQAFNDAKLSFIERLLHVLHRTVIVVSAVPPNVFLDAGSSPAGVGSAGGSSLAGSRWSSLLAEFSLIPIDAPGDPAPPLEERRRTLPWQAGGVSELLWQVNALRFSYSSRFLDDENQDPFVRGVWLQVLPYAWHADRRAPLDLSQLLVEVGERLENYYRGLWSSCTDSERVVLAHVAADDLVNEKDSRIVRALMVRGLIRRHPYFRVMNETFRRFVLSTESTREMTALEGQVSSWDTVRWPFLIMLGALAAVFFTTQHELFNQTVGVVSAVAAGLPAFVKIVSLISGTKRDA